MSQQRAFAQKLNKQQHASDLRRQVASTCSFGKADDLLSGGSNQSMPLYDVVDPVDFEECVAQRKTSNASLTGVGTFSSSNVDYHTYSSAAVRHFSDFPPDDLDLKVIPRDNPVLDSALPVDVDVSKLEPHVRDVLAAYSTNYVALNRKYEQYSTSEAYRRKCAERSPSVKSLTKQLFEVDLDDEHRNSGDESQRASYASAHSDSTANSGGTAESAAVAGGISATPAGVASTTRESWASSVVDLQQLTGDPVLLGVTDRVSANQMDTANDGRRAKNRNSNFFNVYSIQHEEEVVELRQIPSVPNEHRGSKLLIKVLSMKMDVEFEPLFASMALYDAKERKKVSENFYFDFNADVYKGMLRGFIPHQDVSTLCRLALYNITYPSNDLFLVIRLEKVLQPGDIGEAVDPYLKEDCKNREKLRALAYENCERLGAYRMPFAWTAIDLSKVISGASTFVERAESVSTPAPVGLMTSTCTIPSTPDPYLSDSESVVSIDRQSNFSGGTLKRVGSGQSFNRKASLRLSQRSYNWTKELIEQHQQWGIDHFRPLTVTVNNFFKQESDKLSDEDLFKYLLEVRKPSSLMKKLKCIPGTLKIDVSPAPDEMLNLLTSELLRVKPFDNNAEVASLTKEIVEFPLKEVFASNHSYKNLLYIFPKSVNFANRPGLNARNVTVKVQVMHGQDHVLPLIFGRSSCPEFTGHAYTTVSYHNKTPQTYDEIKVKLPVDLSDAHHLLFTFYHVGCRSKSGETAGSETPVGYSWLPLYSNNSLPFGDLALPISLDPLPTSYFYLSPEVNLPNIKWLDNHKPSFFVRLEPVTTVYTQDRHLDTFLHCYHTAQAGQKPVTEAEMQNAIRNLPKAKPEPLIKFLYVVLDKLIDLMVSPPMHNGQNMNIGQTCFEMLGQIAKILTFLVDGFCDQHGRSTLLTTYIQYTHLTKHGVSPASYPGSANTLTRHHHSAVYQQAQADMRRTSSDPDVGPQSPGHSDLLDIIKGFEKATIVPAPSASGSLATSYHAGQARKLLHEEIALHWVVSSGAAREMACANAWFFFELMAKSMGEHLGFTKRLYLPRKMRFSEQFIDDVTTLSTTLTSEVVARCGKDMRLAQNINCSVAFFLRDMISLMNRTYVFNLIKTYCKHMMARASTLPESGNLMLLKLEFLRIICSHEHYITLNLPFASGSLPVSSTPGSTSSLGQAVNSAATVLAAIGKPPSPSPSLSSRSSGGSAAVCSTTSGNSVGAAELTVEFRSHHFLVGLVLADLANVLETNSRLLHAKAINIVRNLISTHDSDARLMDPYVRSKVASLYFPLLGIVMDACLQLYDPYGQRFWAAAGKGGVGGTNRHSQMDHGDEDTPIGIGTGPGLNPNIAMTIAMGTVPSSNTTGPSAVISAPIQPADVVRPPSPSLQPKRTALTLESTRNLLSCFCWVIKHLDQQTLRHWIADLSQMRLNQLLDVLQLCISCFEYRGQGVKKGRRMIQQHAQQQFRQSRTAERTAEFKNKVEDMVLGVTGARSELISRSRSAAGDHHPTPNRSSTAPTTPVTGFGSTLTMPVPAGGVRWRKEHIQYRHNIDATLASFDQNFQLRPDYANDSTSEGNLDSEITLIVLDVLELVVKVASTASNAPSASGGGASASGAGAVESGNGIGGVLTLVMRVLLHAFACNQSVQVLQNMFASQRALVVKYPELLFEEETEQCADLCWQLLRHCAARLQPIRCQAAASLYLLLRQGFVCGSNFARVKMQITVSLSSLVGTSADGKWFNEENLRRSLRTVLTYADEDGSIDRELADTTFCKQVEDLVFNLHMILSDTVKMKEFQDDFEMLVDLMCRIAKGYQTSPDLRLTWLQSLAQKHIEREHFSEAAQCYVHAAALAAEYMRMLEDVEYLPKGAVAFLKLSENVLEESAVSDDVVNPEEEGICESRYFTEPGLVALTEQAVQMFQQAQMYEGMHHAYKILLPIIEQSRDYQKIGAIYARLSESLSKVDNRNASTDKRIFGTYFRVGFYGPKFGDMDGQEFVYREPAITKLPEVSHRLENFYTDRFGAGVVEVIKDSNNVDRQKLDPDKAFLQITYVEPYFDSWELRRRRTHFELNYNVRRFVYATPFTMDGRAHGELKEQYKRKTILSTSHAFPYIKTRIQVVSREQCVLTPIEVAIEDVQKKTKELTLATCQTPPDPKMLQMVLQGCIGTTVNQGPLEIANVFLAGVSSSSSASSTTTVTASNKELQQQHPQKPTDKMQNKLRLCFKDFSKKCADALQANRKLIGPDQREYQKELERNYLRFTESLAPMVSTIALANTLKRRHHHGHQQNQQHGRRNETIDEDDPNSRRESRGSFDDESMASAV